MEIRAPGICLTLLFNIFSHNSDSSLPEETPAKTRKISDCRNVFNTPQPMELCTPLTTKGKGMKLNNVYCPELEMEVTPCVKTHKNLNANQYNQCLYSCSGTKTTTSTANNSMNCTTEVGYSVLEAEEMLRNASLNNFSGPSSGALLKENNMSKYWTFFQTVLKGFADPQLI